MKFWGNKKYLENVKCAIEHTVSFNSFNNKSILILGATGLVCSFLVDMFLLANEEMKSNIIIYAAARSKESLQERFGSETSKLKFVVVNVCDLDLKYEFDYIIHGASFGHPQAFVDEPVEIILSNILGVRNVCQLAGQFDNCKVLYISSGEASSNIDNLQTRACYPESKKAAETLCVSYFNEYGIDVKIARLSHTFGPTYKNKDNRASTMFIDYAVNGKEIVLYSKGNQVRSYTYVADSAAGLLTVLTNGRSGKCYNVAGDDNCSIWEFAQKCGCMTGVPVKIDMADEEHIRQASPISEQIMDNEALKSLGWGPAYTIEQGICNSIRIRKEL